MLHLCVLNTLTIVDFVIYFSTKINENIKINAFLRKLSVYIKKQPIFLNPLIELLQKKFRELCVP